MIQEQNFLYISMKQQDFINMLHFLAQMSKLHKAIIYLFFSILGFGVCCMLTYVGIIL
jgi:hypothetical protein